MSPPPLRSVYTTLNRQCTTRNVIGKNTVLYVRGSSRAASREEANLWPSPRSIDISVSVLGEAVGSLTVDGELLGV